MTIRYKMFVNGLGGYLHVLLVGLLASLIVGCTRQLTESEAGLFFFEYQVLEEGQSVAKADLFADDAKIILTRRSPEYSGKVLVLSGIEWKSIITESVEEEKVPGDYDSYSNITISVDNNTAKIVAQRYSNLRCYYDDTFYLILQRRQDGDLEIIEMRVDSQPESDC